MKNILFASVLIFSILIFSGCSFTKYGLFYKEKKSNTVPGIDDPTIYQLSENEGVYPKSIIFIIADGAGIGQYSMLYYTENDFAPARFEHIGLVSTHPKYGKIKVSDSAASGTALATGEKTYNGAISVDLQQQPLKTMLEWAEEMGMATGLVATSTISHATPAAFGSHIDARKKENEIAQQLAASSIDVLFGGGSMLWDSTLVQTALINDAQVIYDLTEFIEPDRRVVGLFSEWGLPPATENRIPATVDMAQKSIEILGNDPDGFFLMVEESQIDWAAHANSADYSLSEMKSLNDLINYCLDYQTAHPDVLVVLTTDHDCGGLAVNDGLNGDLDIRFSTDYHTANFVPIWASGPGSAAFDAFMDNTEIGKQLIKYIRKK